MFSKLKTITQSPNEMINIFELVSIVKNNPQIDIINRLRSIEYKSVEYDLIKVTKLNCITPHGVFNTLSKNSIVKYSGYLYYDIDNDVENLNDTKKNLIDTGFVSFISVSSGGKGLSFMIKLDDTLIDTLNDTKNIENDTFFVGVYSFVREILIKNGFNIDKQANGLARKMIISNDKDVYYNEDVFLSINTSLLDNYLRETNGNLKNKKSIPYSQNDTFEIIPLEDLLKDLKLETSYKNEINGLYIIDEIDYYKIFIPKIKDGEKRRIYIRLVNALYSLNDNITKQQVYSFIYHINEQVRNKMDVNKLITLIIWLCDNIEKNGVSLKTRIKKIQFNKMENLTAKQKMIIGQKVGAKLKNNKTLKKIEDAKDYCFKNNISPTQKKVAEITGLGIATIKRNWSKDYNDLYDVETPIIQNKIEINENFKMIEENSFFNDEEIKEVESKIVNFKYRGMEDISIEITKDEYDYVKHIFKTLFKSIDILNEYEWNKIISIEKNWDKYKMWYFYNLIDKKYRMKSLT